MKLNSLLNSMVTSAIYTQIKDCSSQNLSYLKRLELKISGIIHGILSFFSSDYVSYRAKCSHKMMVQRANQEGLQTVEKVANEIISTKTVVDPQSKPTSDLEVINESILEETNQEELSETEIKKREDQQEAERAKEEADRSQQEGERIRQEAELKAKEEAEKVQQEVDRAQQEVERTRQETEIRAKEEAERAQQEAEIRAKEESEKAHQEAEKAREQADLKIMQNQESSSTIIKDSEEQKDVEASDETLDMNDPFRHLDISGLVEVDLELEANRERRKKWLRNDEFKKDLVKNAGTFAAFTFFLQAHLQAGNMDTVAKVLEEVFWESEGL